MAQYRSQWTGEVIDDAVGKAKKITYLTIGVDAHDSYQKAGAAFGQSPLYARELLDGDERLYICTYRIDLLGLGYIYYFEYANGSASIYWTLQSSEWSGPVKDSYPTIEYLSKSLGFYESSQTASRNYTKGQYIVWDVAYEYGNRLYVADVDISAGTTLKKSGLNKNLTAVPNGGLNDLKSALDATQTTTTDNLTLASGITANTAKWVLCGKVMQITLRFIRGASGSSWVPIASLPSGISVPTQEWSFVFNYAANYTPRPLRVDGSEIAIYSPEADSVYMGGITIVLQ